jgi:dethiobiotin synthetase
MKPLFVTGIGTGIGKTLISAIIVEKLGADYWKPVQSGDLEQSDTMTVRKLVTNTKSVFHPERFRLTQPFSPHKSAALDGISIHLKDLKTPSTRNQLVIEGAGGLMVPLNDNELFLDLIRNVGAEAILVSMNYLGSINHTLLTAEMLRLNRIPVKGIVFNGDHDEWSESLILSYTRLKLLGRIPRVSEIILSELTPLIDL